MAITSLRLRRAFLSSSFLNRSLHRPNPISSAAASLLSIRTPSSSPARAPPFTQYPRLFTSTATLFQKTFNPETDEIGPDTILFEGCDYNHWLITVDFPRDSNLTREQMIDTYVNIAAKVFGSVEEAKKKIYALSTTTYQGFQVLCSEETSEKFKDIEGVVFVLPDSYIDPVNKEYGGDKYVNGEIFPRPPPVHYGRRSIRDRRPREQMSYQQGNAAYGNQGPPHEQRSYGPPPRQNYGPPPRQNYGQPQQNYGQPPPPPQQNYGQPPAQQNYRPPPQQNYGPPPQQNYGPPPPQNYGPPPPQWQSHGSPQQSYAQPQQNYGPPPQQNYGSQSQQSPENPPNFPSQQNYGSGPPFSGERNPMPPHQGNVNQAEPGNNNYMRGHRDFHQGNWNFQSTVSPDQGGFPQDANHGSSQVPGEQRNFPSIQKY